MLIVRSEDLASRPEPTIERILALLGLPAGWRPADLGERHHRSAQKRVPRAWWRQLGGLVVRGSLPFPAVPESIAGSALTTRALDARDFTVSDDVRRRLEDRLRPDVAKLRTYLGDDFDGWGLLGP